MLGSPAPLTFGRSQRLETKLTCRLRGSLTECRMHMVLWEEAVGGLCLSSKGSALTKTQKSELSCLFHNTSVPSPSQKRRGGDIGRVGWLRTMVDLTGEMKRANLQVWPWS